MKNEEIASPVQSEEVPPPPETVPVELLEKKEKELRDSNDKYLRLLADFENYKKRVSRDQLESMKYAQEPAVKEFLPV